MRGPRTRPPTDLVDYVTLADHYAWMARPYVQDGRVIASSRERPADYPDLPPATWMIDAGFRSDFGHGIYELVTFSPRDLTPTEFRWSDPRDDLRYEGKWRDAERYADWLEQGGQPPPIMVVQHADGNLMVTNGHRRLAAADLAGRDVRAWVSWTVMTQGGVGPTPAGLTYELAHPSLAANPQKPPLQLGHRVAPDFDPVGWYASEKLDGVRAFWDGKRLISRHGNVFAAPDWFTRGWPATPMDGELFGGRGKFNETSGMVRRMRPHDGWKRIVYFVFDLPTHKGLWIDRQRDLAEIVTRADNPYLAAVPHVQIQSKDQMQLVLEKVEQAGGEGLMIIDPQSRYAPTRTHSLLKVKSFQDDEGTVFGYAASKTDPKETGSLWIRDAEGREFKVGGLTHAQKRNARREIPMGSTITFKFFERTPSGKPRFASLWRVREEEPAKRARTRNAARASA